MLASLDTVTLGVTVSLLLTALAALTGFVLATRKTYPGYGMWTLAFMLLACGFYLVVLRGRIPDWASVLIGNYLALASLCLIYDGFASFHGEALLSGLRRCNRLNYALALATAGGMAWYLYRDNNINARIMCFNAFQFFMGLRLCWQVARRAEGRRRAVYLLLATVFIGLAALASWRFSFGLSSARVSSFLQQDVGYRLLVLVDAILEIVAAFGFLLLTHTRIEEELDAALVKAEHASRIDRLTGLWNRHHFETEARREIDRATRYGHALSLLILDIDHFKQVNDRFGHLAGDEALRQVGAAIADSMRTSDLLCRWGGEEFVVVLPAAMADAALAAEKLRAAIERRDIGAVGRLTVSVGLAQWRAGEGLTGWMRRADAALYRAKARGRNRVEREVSAPATSRALHWNEGFRCGDPIIDGQHKILFDTASMLLEKCDGSDRAATAAVMRRLLQAADQHYQYEEAALAKVRYPRLAEHAAEHDVLREKGRAALARFVAGDAPASTLADFAVKSLSFGHIVEEDVHYVSYFKDASSAHPVADGA